MKRPVLIKRKFLQNLTLKKVIKLIVNGMAQETSTTSIFQGAMFPISGKDYKYLPEGKLEVVTHKLYTIVEIDIKAPDVENRVIYEGREYKIYQSKNFLPTSELRTYLLEVLVT